ncbi:MAG: phosphate ABC transporter permease PstA [Pseudomonadota bacterium]|nr:phosphate ABC transporter permease PstA [Pseudomonadota bacterium]
MTTSSSAAQAQQTREQWRLTVANSLGKRRRKEKIFQWMGRLAMITALFFVALLFTSIVSRGLPAFWQAKISLPVYFDPALIQVAEQPKPLAGETPQAFQQRQFAWQSELGMVDWITLLEDTLIRAKPELAAQRDDLYSLYTSGERFRLRDMVINDPSIIGQTITVDMLADANVDVWVRGNIDRSLPDNQQQLSPEVRQLADSLYEQNIIQLKFSSELFTNPDSRSSLASAGLGGAFVGSLYMMLIVIFIAVPIGVASAIYLEEFAPKNKLTDLVEVNINNLAAVPSIVFGLLGAAIFINYFKLPLSAPLVGGLVLSLMTLPTVIITTRAALKAVPPSIRQAALGLGASKVQSVFHHTLPLAIPGILTGAIIGVAQALGESAPLLLIGMSAFVASIPASPMDQASALPVQIYLWQGNELRNFFEARTSAAIMVLLALMLSLNGLAIWLRKKFETRW